MRLSTSLSLMPGKLNAPFLFALSDENILINPTQVTEIEDNLQWSYLTIILDAVDIRISQQFCSLI